MSKNNPSKWTKKRKFRGNRYTLHKECDGVVGSEPRPSSSSEVLASPVIEVRPTPKVTPKSASNHKIGDLSRECEDLGSNNIIVSIDILSKALLSATVCKFCKRDGSLTLKEDVDARQGLACKLLILCNNCDECYPFWTSEKTDGFYDVNMRVVYGLRSIGKGSVSGKTLFGMLDLPKPPLRFERYNPLFLKTLEKIATDSMLKATEEAVELNVSDDGTTSRDISVGIDGTWQKRGFSSLNGVVSVSSFDSSKILDVEVLTKYCHICSVNKGNPPPHFCNKNFVGSSGAMEVEGAKKVFARSQVTRNVKYKYYLGDGDSKGFCSVVNSHPYGENYKIEKLECVGHVQKRMGGRLRKLRKEMKGQKLSDGLRLGGKKGRLTDSVIDSLQNYYGLAIRRNPNDLENMKKDVWATFLHKASTDNNPQHSFCNDSWCKYKQAQKENKSYKHKNALDKVVIEAIRPIFKDLAEPELLKKCLHGRTQNLNESFNSVIWSRIPKVNFVGIQTLKFGTYDAVVCFNEGNKGRMKVLKELGIKVGKNCQQILGEIDCDRVKKADRACGEEAKKSRKRSRMAKKNLLDAEKEKEQDYGAGMF